MTMATSPSSRSPWSPMQHSVDHNGYGGAASPSSQMGDTSMDSKASRQRRGSSPGKRALNWFTRSRSASPAAEEVDDRSGPPSPSSFVVRRVVKQPGGVSHGFGANETTDLQQTYSGQEPYRKVKSRPISLGVPPGGPGGGTGYGTVHSSNDGRPETERAVHGRGRSRSRETSPARPASPGAINAGAFRSNGSRLSPSQLSMRQEQRQQQEQQDRANGVSQPSGPRRPLGSTSPRAATGGSPSPQHANMRISSPVAPTVSAVSAHANENSSRYSINNLPNGSALPPVIPLEGVPSPVKIPVSPRQMGVSPLGSASPGSAMFGTSNDDRSGGSPNAATRWFKGLFGKSPQDDNDDRLPTSSEAQWMRSVTSPNSAAAMSQHNAHAWTDGSPLAGARSRDDVEADALARKQNSMAMAARIEDEHRTRLMNADVPHQQQQQPWAPRQVLGDALMTQEPEQAFPQSRSPPGRKPPPRFTVQDLNAMSQREREQVASEVDPDDRLSKLEGRLTPAQQIIAETRSRMSQDTGADGSARSSSTQIHRGFDTTRRPSNSGVAPDVPAKSVHEAQQGKQPQRMPAREAPQATKSKSTPAHLAGQRQTSQPVASPAGNKGLAAGQGPLPKSMPLADALQEMMVRFYRFERYAVPLMRSLEGRLVDVERDNQMALNGDGMSANSARDREMDRWVGQMTGLMQHEIGQLKAATREIHQAREVLSRLAQSTAGGSKYQETGHESVSKAVSPPAAEATLLQGTNESPRRTSNFSSSSFKSAVRKTDPPTATQEANDTAVNNASPNGRIRYTQALGRPLQDGKISPMVSPTKEHMPFMLPPSRSASEQSSTSRRVISIDDRLKALVNERVRSPSLAASSIKSGVSMHSQVGQIGGDGAQHSIGDASSITHVEAEAPPTKIGDDYELNTGVVFPVAPSDSQHRKTASSQTATTVRPSQTTQAHHLAPVAVSAAPSRTLSTPTTPLAPPLSPNMTGNSLKLATPLGTPMRQQSSSPINVLPGTPSSINAAPHVSQGLRARAQSYLQNADGAAATSTITLSSLSDSSSSNIGNASAATKAVSNGTSPSAILRSRTLTEVGNTLKTSPEHTVRTISSADPVRKPSTTTTTTSAVRPLSIKKSSSSSNTSSPTKSTLRSVGTTDAKQGSTTRSAGATPSRPSIKDRVAFFDSAQRVA